MKFLKKPGRTPPPTRDGVVFGCAGGGGGGARGAVKTSLQLTVGESLKRAGDSCNMLVRTITRLETGYSLCGDDALARLSITELGLESAKSVATPSVSNSKEREGSIPRDAAAHTKNIGGM